MFVLFFSYLWRLRVWVFKEYIQNGFVFFRLNREYKSRFQQFTARWQLLFFLLSYSSRKGKSDAVSQSFGSVVEPKRLGFRLLFLI
ncbi:hypothetical protein OUZ56_009446 [Daphnia magna]|uniref:Uncharacterized protein n=1 Tax=Daphnia magna TaxID=35525 RepID=A0ABR0AG23_9CRUS|nr:hypothetical protein OUZ56_009446 [Daphnia magna]